MAWCLHTPNYGGVTSPPVASPTPLQWHANNFPAPADRVADLQALRSPAVVLFDGRSNLSLAGLEPRCCSTFILRDQASARHALTGEAKPEAVNRSNGIRFLCRGPREASRLRASIAATHPRLGSILIRNVVVLSPVSKSFFGQYRYVITRIPCVESAAPARFRRDPDAGPKGSGRLRQTGPPR